MSKALTTSKIGELREYMRRDDIRAAISENIPKTLSKYMTHERITRLVMSAWGGDMELQKCTIQSLAKSVMDVVRLGLEPFGSLGHAYIIPYRNNKTGTVEPQVIIGYRGFIALARRSGEILSIFSCVVHENDTLDVEFGVEQRITHKPCLKGDPGPMIAVYCIAKFKDGSHQIDFMTRAQVDAIRDRGKAKKFSPWMTDYEEMARKTVVRRAAKYWPLSQEMQSAFELEDRDPAQVPMEATWVEDEPKESTATDKLLADLGGDDDAEPHDPETGEVIVGSDTDRADEAFRKELAKNV